MGKQLQKKEVLKEVIWFLIKFNLLLIPFYAIIYFDVNFYSIQSLFAGFIASFLRLFGYYFEVSGFFIYTKGMNIDISRDCIGWKSIYSVVALVLASPGKLKKKLSFLIFWVPVLFFINIFRVVGIILVGLRFGVNYLELLHKFFWQEVMVFVIIGIWYLWLRKINKLNKKKNNINIGV